MASRKRGRSKGSRVYWRNRREVRRAYGDFRDLADAGGGREALIPRGESFATTDPDVAERLAAERVRELTRMRRDKTLIGATGARLEDFAAHHLEAKARAGTVTRKHLDDVTHRLRVAVEHFGADRTLDSIGVRDVEAWLARLGEGGRSAMTLRHYLAALSNLYRRAASEGVVLPGFNPCAALMDKPVARRVEARWLQVHEAALLLESARTYRPARPDMATPGVHAVLATLLLTGGRKSEVLGLDVEDVSFDRRTVTFRPNKHRRLKTLTSRRAVPMWPQLEEVLRRHVFERSGPLAGLLFPGRGGRMVGDLDKTLDAIAARGGWEAGEVRSKMFRHTYCAARLQTLDRGAPVSAFTVSRELGHGGLRLVDRIYGHLGEVRHSPRNRRILSTAALSSATKSASPT
ncbi:MAG TPA: tyrosine-type recombinase/integrase [Gemmatimonadota bacterium]|nr:tyrosine-type recombinase/integrase [Gemmatimonadota bacterium]